MKSFLTDEDDLLAYLETWTDFASTHEAFPSLAEEYVETILKYVRHEDEPATNRKEKGKPQAAYSDPAKELLAWLEDELRAPTSARFVALVLLLHRNSKTGHTWPSQSTIATLTGYSVRTVRGALHWLKTVKVIEEVKPYQFGKDRYASAVYRFHKSTPI